MSFAVTMRSSRLHAVEQVVIKTTRASLLQLVVEKDYLFFDYYLKIKYILLPWLIMELLVLLYYHKVTFFIIKTVMENSN